MTDTVKVTYTREAQFTPFDVPQEVFRNPYPEEQKGQMMKLDGLGQRAIDTLAENFLKRLYAQCNLTNPWYKRAMR